jgi:hypothetical protein
VEADKLAATLLGIFYLYLSFTCQVSFSYFSPFLFSPRILEGLSLVNIDRRRQKGIEKRRKSCDFHFVSSSNLDKVKCFLECYKDQNNRTLLFQLHLKRVYITHAHEESDSSRM